MGKDGDGHHHGDVALARSLYIVRSTKYSVTFWEFLYDLSVVTLWKN